MGTTLHAAIRAQQRCIPPLVDQLLDQYGEESYDGHGCLRKFFSHASIRAIKPKGSASIDILRSSNATPPTHQTSRNASAPFCNGASTDFRSELDEKAHAGKARQTGGQGESEARAGRSNGFLVLTWSA